MNFEFLFKPVEELDSLITGLFDGAPLLVALGIAFLLGLRHASDPGPPGRGDLAGGRRGRRHQEGRSPGCLVGSRPRLRSGGDRRTADRVQDGAAGRLESGAEKAIGALILVLAARVIYKWARGDYRATAHAHEAPTATGAPPPPGTATGT